MNTTMFLILHITCTVNFGHTLIKFMQHSHLTWRWSILKVMNNCIFIWCCCISFHCSYFIQEPEVQPKTSTTGTLNQWTQDWFLIHRKSRFDTVGDYPIHTMILCSTATSMKRTMLTTEVFFHAYKSLIVLLKHLWSYIHVVIYNIDYSSRSVRVKLAGRQL